MNSNKLLITFLYYKDSPNIKGILRIKKTKSMKHPENIVILFC